MKQCSKCKCIKDLSEFNKDQSKKDGLHPSCRQCKKITDKKYREANITKVKNNDKEYYKKNVEAIKQRSKDWYEKNKTHCQQVKREWYGKNFEKVKNARTDYMQQDTEKWKEYMKSYQRERYRTNVQYRIKTILNKRIRDYACKKGRRTLDIVGCSIDFFIKWIETQFDDSMTWENQGSYWDFDHVTPCASFDLTNHLDVLRCYNWCNLRPCEKKENIVKKDKIIDDLIQKQNELAQKFKLLCDAPKR